MSKKIKILHVQETIGSGGVERRRLSLARNLDKQIFDQKFVCTQTLGNIPDEIRNEGFEVLEVGRLQSPLHWTIHKKMQQIIEEYQPDIIHGAVFEGVTLAAINGWLKKVPIIIIEETSDPQNRSWKGHLLMKFFSMLADKVIGVSQAVTEEYLYTKLKISNTKAITINNGVAMPRIVTSEEVMTAKSELKILEDDYVIGSVGRMVHDEHKKFSILIKAFANFAKNKTKVKLLLVGDGPEMSNYVHLVDTLGIKNNVIFAGYQADVTLYYNMMNVFALVSAREAFGLVLAEAMLNKLPVIATRVGGMKYIVKHNVTGFLIDVGNIEEISEKLQILYEDQKLMTIMGQSGQSVAFNNFSEERYVKDIADMYTALVFGNIP